MRFITTRDGVEIHYKDRGSGQPVVLSHAWPLNSDRSQAYKDLADGPFFGNNRAGANVSQGMREDLKKFDVPTLVIHGDDDQVVPFEVGGKASAALVPDAELKVYPG